MVVLAFAVAFGLSVWMAVAWVYQRMVANGGWTDVFWSFGMGAGGVAVALWPLGGETTTRQWIAAALMAVWSLRLGGYLLRRTLGSDREDPRYAGFRKDWGQAFQGRMFYFLQAQALAGTLLCVAVLVAARNPAPGLAWSDIAAGLIMAGGIAGESLADAQLSRFKADPKNRGKVCDVGLWGWSRHPNYFFEWTIWLAWPVMALGTSLTAWPWGWLALVGPAFMAFLLIRVSGVPPLEQAMLKSRGKAYADYQARVSAFFPLPPKA